jgi:hypothetical protein
MMLGQEECRFIIEEQIRLAAFKWLEEQVLTTYPKKI